MACEVRKPRPKPNPPRNPNNPHPLPRKWLRPGKIQSPPKTRRKPRPGHQIASRNRWKQRTLCIRQFPINPQPIGNSAADSEGGTTSGLLLTFFKAAERAARATGTDAGCKAVPRGKYRGYTAGPSASRLSRFFWRITLYTSPHRPVPHARCRAHGARSRVLYRRWQGRASAGWFR